MDNWKEVHEKFSQAFRPEEIGTNQSNKGGGPYVDARSVAERLDEVVGPGDWSTSFHLIDAASGAVECSLTVRGISKSDIGYPNSVMGTLTKSGTILENEPLKAAYSDAFKRAAVQWGIGRYLYPYASKRKREPGEEEEAKPSRISPPQTSGYPTKQSAKTEAVAPHIPDIAALQEEVKAAIVTVAEAQNNEARDVMKQAVREAAITTPGGWPNYTVYDLNAILTWCRKQIQ